MQEEIVLRNKLPSLPKREAEERRRTLKRKITEDEVWDRLSGDFTKSVPKIQFSTLRNQKNASEFLENKGEEVEKINQSENEQIIENKQKEEEETAKAENDSEKDSNKDLDSDRQEKSENESDKLKSDENSQESFEDKEENNDFFEYYNDDAIVEPDGAKAVALWDFRGECDSDLAFNKGDIVTVIRKYDNGWWEGEVNGLIGDFPFNFVELISKSDESDDDDDCDDFGNEIIPVTPSSPSNLRNSSPGISNNTLLPKENTSDIKKRLTVSRPQSSSNVTHTPKALPIKQGYLIKKGHKRRNWKVRYFVLESSKLSYYANPADAGVSKRMKGFIALQKNSLVKLAPEMKRSNCFAIHSDVKPFVIYIAAPTGDDMVSWMESISIARTMGD